ncbi:MAG: hypothetical protein M1823_004785 [Watsoniomyces obsoletus]|nr:MAG: hypothetical protein M1823_004785 [Watsoniomyces obsoletus]
MTSPNQEPQPASSIPNFESEELQQISRTRRTRNPSQDPPRLSLPWGLRLTAAITLASATGLGLGISQGSRTTALRFRAENAHRQPTTATGWYLYHKSKNYNVMFGGITQGLKTAGRFGAFVGGFYTVEEAVDRLRGTKDFMSTVVAGLGIAGAFSVWNRFPVHTAAKTAKTGLILGLAYGFAQDAMAMLRGHRVSYAAFIADRMKRIAGRRGEGRRLE